MDHVFMQDTILSLAVWITAALIFITSRIKSYKEAQGAAKTHDAVRRLHDVYGILGELAVHTGASRSLIVRAHNGGDNIRASTEAKISVLYEHFLHGEPIRNQVQSIPVDRAYVSVLKAVVDGGWCGGPEDLEPGYLRDLFDREDVPYAMLWPIGQVEKEFMYLAIHFPLRLTDTQLSAKRSAVFAACSQILRLMY
jgi:hypothetical protein